ncbi:hypothetical protein G3570_00060 [Balneolaceae bacterium YR4-1]|uniref:Uncharacterized protein n=1 Tax=Halalkalibaculum roseum TaxID=2709311 RepID=A0A6M1SWT6_9BACT|nr:hypothetical protein [Halalkalibaculum roseum]NGP75007.1 hypothetical protein [Halalkalibaculum roseum]
MKLLSRVSLIIALLLFVAGAVTNSHAQSQKSGNKGNKEKAEKVQNKGKAVADSVQQTAVPDSTRKKGNAKAKAGKENQGQGNAYGRNKGDMSGREFGQARAAAAKKLQEEISALDQKVTEGEEVAEKAREDIRTAEENLENAEGDSTVINRRVERVEKAKEQLSELEVMLENQKEKLSKARSRFEELMGRNPQPDSTATEENEEE